MATVDLTSVLLIALALSADCFAVAAGISVSGKDYHLVRVFRVAAAFGFAQALMPLIGYLAGRVFIDLISGYDHWVAFGLLTFVGGRMIWESFHKKEKDESADVTRGFLLLTLAIATSIDSLAAGLTFAFLKIDIWTASLIIGLTAFAITVIGFLVGRKVGRLVGERAETAGGLVLIAIALRILISHILE